MILKNIEYKRYGALGVKVCLRWHCFEYFKEDVVLLPGFDLNLFLNNKIQLDKDKKQIHLPISKRIYSPYTCVFLNSEENNYYSKNHYKFIAIDPKGKVYEGKNLSVFCKKHNINKKQAYSAINGWQNTVKGWIFKKKNECND